MSYPLLSMPPGAEAIYGRNCEKGRDGFKPDWIVLHITYGSWQSVLNCLTASNIKDYQRSSHLWVDRWGELYHMVDFDDTAWTCGLLEPRGSLLHPNQRAINLEYICEEGQIVTDMQYESSRWAVKQLLFKYNIPVAYPSTGFEGRYGSVNGVKTYIHPDDDELLTFRGIMGHSALTKNRSGDPGYDHFDIHKLLGK